VINPKKQTKVLVTVLANNLEDMMEVNSLYLLSTLLTDGPNAPFFKSLIEPNIGSDYSPGTGYSPYGKEATFGFGLQDIAEEDVDKVRDIINDTLKDVVKNGLDKRRIESVLHQIEMGQKNVTTRYGMSLFNGISSAWVHGSDVVQFLKVDQYISALRRNWRRGRILNR